MTGSEVEALVEAELLQIADESVVKSIHALRVTPYPVKRGWDYGLPEESYVCWTVLEHRASNTCIAYCSQGFGPFYPWGLVSIEGEFMNMGMDSQWYLKLEDAFRVSKACDEPLPEDYELRWD